MERLTSRHDGRPELAQGLKERFLEQSLFFMLLSHLAAYEDAMPLGRAQELAQAEKDGRLVVLPCGEGDELLRNGLTFKADHWNALLTAFADDVATPSGKKVKLFYPEEAEAALKKREEADNEAKP